MENLNPNILLSTHTFGGNVHTLSNEYKKNFKDFMQAYQASTVPENVARATTGTANPPRAIMGVLRANEPTINRALIEENLPTSGDVVQKSVRLYNATESRKNAVGGGAALLAALKNPAVQAAILALVSWLISTFGSSRVKDETITEGEAQTAAERTRTSPEDMAVMVKRLLDGSLSREAGQKINQVTMLIVGVLAVFVILILWLANKK